MEYLEAVKGIPVECREAMYEYEKARDRCVQKVPV
jgi:hypothetical protein